MSALPVLKDAALTLDARVAVLTFKRDDVRNALTAFFAKRQRKFKGC